MGIYTTVQGDTWDKISFNVYGNSKHIGILMENNYDLLNIFVFSAGTEVNYPELTEEESQDVPEWRL